MRGEPRIDGRDNHTVRPLFVETGVLPKTHGSSLFTRGETQALVVATLGSIRDGATIDALEGSYRDNFMLHYNFPPYSVGEVGDDGQPETARDRPWPAGAARYRGGVADSRGVPLHHPCGVGDHRIQRLQLDGHGLRRLAGADGCRGADLRTGGRDRHGADQGRERLLPC